MEDQDAEELVCQGGQRPPHPRFVRPKRDGISRQDHHEEGSGEAHDLWVRGVSALGHRALRVPTPGKAQAASAQRDNTQPHRAGVTPRGRECYILQSS